MAGKVVFPVHKDMVVESFSLTSPSFSCGHSPWSPKFCVATGVRIRDSTAAPTDSFPILPIHDRRGQTRYFFAAGFFFSFLTFCSGFRVAWWMYHSSTH